MKTIAVSSGRIADPSDPHDDMMITRMPLLAIGMITAGKIQGLKVRRLVTALGSKTGSQKTGCAHPRGVGCSSHHAPSDSEIRKVCFRIKSRTPAQYKRKFQAAAR
jgi:hypothetical protein